MGRIADGLLIIDKPVGPTSFDIVGRIRKELCVKKVGHCGTLDPAAGGVLLVVLGRATRLAEYTNNYRKEYEAVIRLGATTDTDDGEGRIIAELEVPDLYGTYLDELLSDFTGEIEQRVPVYSAVKIKGERLYKKARRGDTVDAPIRKVTIYNIDILSIETPEIKLRVECGGGTYIRSLARDIGEKLGCGAYLSELTRIEVGPYYLKSACKPETVTDLTGNEGCYIPFDELLPDLPSIGLDIESAVDVTHGRTLAVPEGVEQGRIKLIFEDKLIAVAEVDNEKIKPAKVFVEAGDLR